MRFFHIFFLFYQIFFFRKLIFFVGLNRRNLLIKDPIILFFRNWLFLISRELGRFRFFVSLWERIFREVNLSWDLHSLIIILVIRKLLFLVIRTLLFLFFLLLKELR